MSTTDACCSVDTTDSSPQFKRILIVALLVNATMFVIEIVASRYGDSVALQADALDFFGDSANYAISLLVVGSSLLVRARAAMFKGLCMAIFGVFVLASAITRMFYGSTPEPMTIGGIGVIALAANVFVATLLYRYREGDSNMRSIWLCSRNDAIGNIAVICAALGVLASATRWPDLFVAMLIASLSLVSSWQVLRLAQSEIRSTKFDSSEIAS